MNKPLVVSTLFTLILLLLGCLSFEAIQPAQTEDSLGIGLPAPSVPVPGPSGEVIVRIEPCVTPTTVADYRELLPPGTVIYKNGYYLKGYNIEGQEEPTPAVSSDGSSSALIDPLTARIVYTSYSPCMEDTATIAAPTSTPTP